MLGTPRTIRNTEKLHARRRGPHGAGLPRAVEYDRPGAYGPRLYELGHHQLITVCVPTVTHAVVVGTQTVTFFSSPAARPTFLFLDSGPPTQQHVPPHLWRVTAQSAGSWPGLMRIAWPDQRVSRRQQSTIGRSWATRILRSEQSDAPPP